MTHFCYDTNGTLSDQDIVSHYYLQRVVADSFPPPPVFLKKQLKKDRFDCGGDCALRGGCRVTNMVILTVDPPTLNVSMRMQVLSFTYPKNFISAFCMRILINFCEFLI